MMLINTFHYIYLLYYYFIITFTIIYFIIVLITELVQKNRGSPLFIKKRN